MNKKQIKTELVHDGYLSGWEILHYKNLLKAIKKIGKKKNDISNR